MAKNIIDFYYEIWYIGYVPQKDYGTISLSHLEKENETIDLSGGSIRIMARRGHH